jgi:transcriptional regulator with XRE-family HTH domain
MRRQPRDSAMLRRTVSKSPALSFDRKTVGQRVKAARKAKKWSTEKLAEETGIGVEALYKKQRGAAPFDLDELPLIRDALEAPGLFPLLDLEQAEWMDKMLALIPGRK